jgi:hypothetical protein
MRPFLRCHDETVQSCLFSKPLEFKGVMGRSQSIMFMEPDYSLINNCTLIG